MHYAVLTGDVINSRKLTPKIWLAPLKQTLNQYGAFPENWEIYRGDSFQLECKVEKALIAAIHLKASIKQYQGMDVRMAIGIGNKTYKAERITESNGLAFQRSGDAFDQLKKRTLIIRTGNQELDEELNMYLILSCLSMDAWAIKTALTVKVMIENPGKTQIELEKLLNTKQSGISASLKRSGFDDLLQMNQRYLKLISQL